MASVCPEAVRSCPVGCKAIVIMVPNIAAINAKLLLRSSVMALNLDLNCRTVNSALLEMPSCLTKRPTMSGKKPTWKKGTQLKLKAAGKPKADRRALRTRNVLGDALVELMQQRPFHSIKVQDVLDRAGVSRSTFYTHYRDKDDLFLSDVEDFWEMLSSMLDRRGEESQRVAP